MENSMLFELPFDPAYIIVILSGLVVILLILVIAAMAKLKKLSRKYDYFMRGKDAETLEDVILDQLEEIRILKAEDRAAKDSIRTLNRNFRSSFQTLLLISTVSIRIRRQHLSQMHLGTTSLSTLYL